MAISKDNDRLTIIINRDIKKALEEIAKRDSRSVSNYVANLLEKHVLSQSSNKELD
ncbi:DNA-binding protein [uncultured Clostridium sp.]|uniref:DNA-binding protein n=1 Tax=uncultured Clostridium sp. TaxID=59620 RepID=UPI0032174B0A